MDPARIAAEIRTVEEMGYTVTRDAGYSQIVIRNVELPMGWQPQQIDIELQLGRDYPYTPPAVHVPADLTYQTMTPPQMTPVSPYEERTRYNMNLNWHPKQCTLSTVVDKFLNEMAVPFPQEQPQSSSRF